MYNALILTFVLTWGATGAFYFLDGQLDSPAFLFFGFFVMWIPGIVALLFAYKEGLHLVLFTKSIKSYLIAGTIGLIIAILTILFSLLFAEYKGLEILRLALPPPLNSMHGWLYQIATFSFLVITILVAGLTINTIAAMGEELMWRGYLWKKLATLGFFKANIIIGFLWGLWHLPLVIIGLNYPGHPFLGSILMILVCLVFSPLFATLRQNSNAIIIPAVLHGTINASGRLTLILFEDPNPLIIGTTGIMGIAATAIVFLFVANRTK